MFGIPTNMAGFLDGALGYMKNKKKETAEVSQSISSALKTFSFTSIGGGTGSSMILLYIAQYLAKEEGKQVCLLDLDFLQPDLLYNLNVDVTTENTIINYLKGFKTLEECFIQDQLLKSLYLVTASPKDDLTLMMNLKNDDDIIGSLIDRLQVFDYVLINLPYRQPMITFIEPISRIDRGYLVLDERFSGMNKLSGFLEFIHVYQDRFNSFNQVILNKRTSYDYPYEKITDELKCDIISEIPFEENIVHSMNVKKQLLDQNLSAKIQKGLIDIMDDMKK